MRPIASIVPSFRWGCASFVFKEVEGFDKLSPNGGGTFPARDAMLEGAAL
jgi:hypothetical protein